MRDLPPYSDSNDDPGVRPSRRTTTGTPRWVQVFGIIFIVLVLLFVVLHLTGQGFRGLHGDRAPASSIASSTGHGMHDL